MNSNFVPGLGYGYAKLMIIGEAPGSAENDSLIPFYGPSGQYLDRVIKSIGYPNWRNECYITNVFKWQPPENNFERIEETGHTLKEALEILNSEIQTINPNLLLVLGKNAYNAMGLDGKWDEKRGSIQAGYGRKIVNTYHPARFLYGKAGGEFQFEPYEKAVFQADLIRAFKECEFKDLRLPARNLHVVENSNQFYQFLTKWSGKTKLAEDIESINHIPFCISLCFNPSEAISIPLFDHPLGKNRSSKDVARMWLMLDKVHNDPKIKIIGQNFKYDEPKLRKLGLWIHNLHSDTMLKGHVVCPEFPKSLGFQTSIHTREPFYKSDYEAFKTGKSSIERFMLYNCKDAAVTWEIDDVLEGDLEELGMLEFYYEFVMKLHYLYLDMEEVGMMISEDIRQEIIGIWCKKQAEMEIELFKLLGMHLNVASPKQVQLALHEKLKLPFRAGTGEDVLVALLGNHCKKYEQRRAIELILADRKIRRLLSTTLGSPTDYDGRMRTSVFICATETRRTSNELLKSPIRPFNCGIGFQTLSKHGEAGIIRKMFIPDPGYVFINFDQSQAEARVCSLLADDEDTLKAFDTIDIHALTASWIFGGTWEKHSKAMNNGNETPERFCGKTLRHAGHLDMQKRTAMSTINTGAQLASIDLVVSEYKAGKFLEIFHKYTPRIRSHFHIGIQEALKRDSFYLTGSSPCVGKNWFPKRQFFGDWERETWKGAYSFIPQQTVTDKTKWILLQLKQQAKFLKIVGESHDAGLLLCPENLIKEAVEIIKEFGNQPIDFSRCSISRRNLTIPIDIEIGRENYKELKKYKLSPEIKTEKIKVVDPRSVFEMTR